MSVKENRALVRSFLEAHAKGDLDTVEEMLAPDFVDHRIVIKTQPQETLGFELYSQRAASSGWN